MKSVLDGTRSFPTWGGVAGFSGGVEAAFSLGPRTLVYDIEVKHVLVQATCLV